MTKKVLLLLIMLCAAPALALSGCGSATYAPPQVIYVTAPAPLPSSVYNLLPVEAQRIVDQATATAAVYQTQQSAQSTEDARQATQDARVAAQALATDQSSRQMATAARGATLDALAGQETAVGLALTQGAGQAAATTSASIHTAEADQTAAAGTPTARAVAIAIAATGTQLARSAETSVRRQALDDQVAQARGWLMLGLMVLLLLALGAALVFGISDLISARAEMMRAQAARAQAEAMQLWIMQYGGVLLQLRQGQWERMDTPQLPAPAVPALENLPSNIHEVPVRTKGEVVSSIPVGAPETPERARVAHLLMQAVAIAGPTAGVIPSADRLGMHRQEWQDAVNLLKAGQDRLGYVITSPGRPKAGQEGRTRLCQPGYRTLGALLDGLKRGEVLPPPPPAKPEPAA